MLSHLSHDYIECYRTKEDEYRDFELLWPHQHPVPVEPPKKEDKRVH